MTEFGKPGVEAPLLPFWRPCWAKEPLRSNWAGLA